MAGGLTKQAHFRSSSARCRGAVSSNGVFSTHPKFLVQENTSVSPRKELESARSGSDCRGIDVRVRDSRSLVNRLPSRIELCCKVSRVDRIARRRQ